MQYKPLGSNNIHWRAFGSAAGPLGVAELTPHCVRWDSWLAGVGSQGWCVPLEALSQPHTDALEVSVCVYLFAGLPTRSVVCIALTCFAGYMC